MSKNNDRRNANRYRKQKEMELNNYDIMVMNSNDEELDLILNFESEINNEISNYRLTSSHCMYDDIEHYDSLAYNVFRLEQEVRETEIELENAKRKLNHARYVLDSCFGK